MENKLIRYATELEVLLYTQPVTEPSERWLNWQEYDQGPGIFDIPMDMNLGIRVQFLDDAQMKIFVRELENVTNLRYLHFAENRRLTNKGALLLSNLAQIEYLNLSSCDINNEGLAFLPALSRLKYLNLSYCNRITEASAKYTQKLQKLTYLDLQGAVKVNTGGMKKFEKRNLTIFRP